MAVDRQRIYHKRERLRQLRAFCYAVRLGSMTQAAEHLGITQPMVSLHVRDLEYELEAILFDRGFRRISPTLAGERFYNLAKPLLEGVDGLFVKLRERRGDNLHGRLSLAASMAATSFVLPSYVKRFRDEHPNVRVRVQDCSLGEGVGLLLENEVEFVLSAKDRYPEATIEYHHLLAYDTVLIASMEHPLAGRSTVTLEEAAAWPVILLSAGSQSGPRGDVLAGRLGNGSGAVLEVDAWGVVKRCVENGLGISLVPATSLSETDHVAAIPIEDIVPTRSFGVFVRRKGSLTSIARRFIQLMIPGYPGRTSNSPARID